MWCSKCQSDVAAEVTGDNRRIHCATCGGEITTSQLSTSTLKTHEARELLDRWSKDEILDPFGPLPASRDESSQPLELNDIKTHSETASQGVSHHSSHTAFRVDEGHARTDPPQFIATEPSSDDNVEETLLGSGRTVGELLQSRRHDPHSGTAGAPHFDVASANNGKGGRKGEWATFAGQLMAYAGVAALTVGTVLVLWGYFGGPGHYIPTGWLITTAGQMLLFLGVVTLISGGMEQTTEEVARKIETLGDKILRIEHASREHALRGPSIPAQRFAEGETESTAKSPATEHQLRP
jgi:hypothetical protein